MLYNEERIRVYGSDRLEKSLLNKERIHLSSTDEHDARYANSFEHYLVKVKMNQ